MFSWIICRWYFRIYLEKLKTCKKRGYHHIFYISRKGTFFQPKIPSPLSDVEKKLYFLFMNPGYEEWSLMLWTTWVRWKMKALSILCTGNRLLMYECQIFIVCLSTGLSLDKIRPRAIDISTTVHFIIRHFLFLCHSFIRPFLLNCHSVNLTFSFSLPFLYPPFSS